MVMKNPLQKSLQRVSTLFSPKRTKAPKHLLAAEVAENVATNRDNEQPRPEVFVSLAGLENMDPEQPKAALTESHKEAPGEKLLQADVRKSEHVNKLRSQMATRQPSTRNVGGTVVISDHVGTPTKRESMTIEADEIGEGGQSIVSYRFVDCKFFDIILNKEKVGQLDFVGCHKITCRVKTIAITLEVHDCKSAEVTVEKEVSSLSIESSDTVNIILPLHCVPNVKISTSGSGSATLFFKEQEGKEHDFVQCTVPFSYSHKICKADDPKKHGGRSWIVTTEPSENYTGRSEIN